MKVLIAIPRATAGGVKNHFNVLRPYLSAETDYFELGAGDDRIGLVGTVLRLIQDSFGFRKKLRSGAYDIVHINPSLGPKAIVRDGIMLLIAKANHVPVLVFMHGWDIGCEQVIRKYFLSLFCFVYGKADLILVLANEFLDKLRDMGLTSRIALETTLVDDSVFANDIPDRTAGIDGKKYINILFLSRLDVGKGLPEAIDAFRQLTDQVPDISLTIVGDGPDRNKMQTFVSDNSIKNVQFLGYVDEEQKRAAYLEADIYFFPTMYGEGMPASVLEAMAYGLPVVTRRVGALQDFFVEGRMGCITDSRDSAIFADMLRGLLLDSGKRKEMGDYNRDYAENRFAASRVAMRLEQVYADTIACARL